jgi:pyruvate/2-oxoacid:ferredoxin oxidoreductase alpha subunit
MGLARKKGLKVGLFRPVSLFPFPTAQIAALALAGKRFLVAELSAGQMVEDVRLAVNGAARVDFYGKMGGTIMTPPDVLEQVEECLLRPVFQGFGQGVPCREIVEGNGSRATAATDSSASNVVTGGGSDAAGL